jgi:hypothetical protein
VKAKKIRMGEVQPSAGWSNRALSREAGWIDSYAGTEGGHEVFSVGLPYFRNQQTMRALYDHDPDHFSYVLSILRGDFL